MHISRNATNINIVSPYLFIPLLTRNTRAEKGRIAARENDMRKRTLEYIVRRRRPPGGLGTRFNAMHRALHARSNAISCLTTPYPRSPRHDTVTAYKSYARSRGTRVCVIPTLSSRPWNRGSTEFGRERLSNGVLWIFNISTNWIVF